jgi:hypothetical protein
LTTEWNDVAQVTANILNELSGPASTIRIANSSFERWTRSTQPSDWRVVHGAAASVPGLGGLPRRAVELRSHARPAQLAQSGIVLEGRNHYRLGCWVRSESSSAAIELRVGSLRIARATHPGNGRWVHLSAVGEGSALPPITTAEVRLFVGRRKTARFDRVSLEYV